MAIDDRAKLNLYNKLIEVLGQEDADTLMDLLFEARAGAMRHGNHPSDLRVKVAALRSELAGLRAEIARLRAQRSWPLGRALTG